MARYSAIGITVGDTQQPGAHNNLVIYSTISDCQEEEAMMSVNPAYSTNVGYCMQPVVQNIPAYSTTGISQQRMVVMSGGSVQQPVLCDDYSSINITRSVV